MKLLLSTFCLWALCLPLKSVAATERPTLLCQGSGWITFKPVPFPIKRDITVAIFTQKGSNQGRIEAEAGGDPMFYSGTIFTDGRDMTTVDPDNGDIIVMNLKSKTPYTQAQFTMSFYSAQREKQGGVQPTSLRCKR